jgi:hypothetical protein
VCVKLRLKLSLTRECVVCETASQTESDKGFVLCGETASQTESAKGCEVVCVKLSQTESDKGVKLCV